MLRAGEQLGSYQIVEPIGAGGMGEVYRAHDVRLGRHVAIKVLPVDAAADPDRVARFAREARTLASLNHPNIAQIYGVEESSGVVALVMELISGPTLADRLTAIASASTAQTRDVPEMLSIARQIADALETAHDAGIVHRDLKPANVKVRDDGVVKVLDFGLAKMLDPAQGSSSDAQSAATVTSPAMTIHGAILGTAAYMAPEQARGQVVDRRADIWSFGAVLFEMLSGRRAFEGADVMETLAAVIGKMPDFNALPADISPRVRELVERCLVRDRRQRLQSIGEARICLERALANPDFEASAAGLKTGGSTTTGGSVMTAGGSIKTGARRVLPWAIATLTTVFAGALWVWRPTPPPAPAPLRFNAELSPSAQLMTGLTPSVQFSPDGTLIAFLGRTADRDVPQLFVRRVDESAAQPLSGTDDAFEFFFSPDSKWLGFFAGTKLKRISVAGGTAATVCEISNARGGEWSSDGFIILARSSRSALLRVPAEGGTPEPLTTLDAATGEITHRFPQLLPGGHAVMYTAHSNSITFDDANVFVQPLASGERKLVVRGGYRARYVSSGHLLYVHEGKLMALPFDLNRLEAAGKPVLVLDDMATAAGSAGAQYAVSSSGTLAYLPVHRQPVTLSWLERGGRVAPLSPKGHFSWPQFSPDGRQIAFGSGDPGRRDISVYDLARDVITPLTRDGFDDERPLWSPDGRRIVFSSDRGADGADIYWKRTDGVGSEQRLTTVSTQERELPLGWHPRELKLVVSLPFEWRGNLSWLPIDGDEVSGWQPGRLEAIGIETAGGQALSFSPDGRWIVYTSREMARNEVYVRRFPELDRTQRLSVDGGNFPVWSRTGKEIFYQQGAKRIMVVAVSPATDDLQPGKPAIFAETRLASENFKSFDVHPDGMRVLILAGSEAATAVTHAVFVVNFLDHLRRIAPSDSNRSR